MNQENTNETSAHPTVSGRKHRLVRLMKWTVWNTCEALLIWQAIAGSVGAGRLLAAVLWSLVPIYIICLFNSESHEQLKRLPQAVPAWVTGAVKLGFAGYLVWHGWWWTAAAIIITWSISTAIKQEPNAKLKRQL